MGECVVRASNSAHAASQRAHCRGRGGVFHCAMEMAACEPAAMRSERDEEELLGALLDDDELTI